MPGRFTTASKIELELSKAELSHVLRHTFASCFMQGGGNILALQRILDHKGLDTTMRYAHLSPQHLQEVKSLNPLTALRIGCDFAPAKPSEQALCG